MGTLTAEVILEGEQSGANEILSLPESHDSAPFKRLLRVVGALRVRNITSCQCPYVSSCESTSLRPIKATKVPRGENALKLFSSSSKPWVP